MSKTQRLNELYIRTERELAPYVRFGTVVFGTGDPDAQLVLIGEAPGKNEAEQGVPFVGAAGKNLDALLAAHGIRRDNVYITNIVKYRPVQNGARPGTFRNRTPRRDELSLCRTLLLEELAILSPRIVATLGNSPLRALLDAPSLSVGDLHGQTLRDPAFPFLIMPLYHPASVIYNRSLITTLDDDLAKLGKLL